jgi:chaperonin GroEL
MSKKILFKEDAQAKIMSGVKQLADVVATTMGPRGKNVILGKFVGAPVITKDGVSVAREVVLKDEHEETACQLVKEAAGRTADIAGDGTTTATVLTHEIFSNGINLINSGLSPIHFRDGLNWGCEEICKNIDIIKKSVNGIEDLTSIASISANNDYYLGSKIAEAFEYAGLDGTVAAEASPGIHTTVKKISGIEMKNGYITPAFLTNANQKDIVFENCRILLLDRDMTHFSDCFDLFNKLHETSTPILVLAKDVKQEALATLVANNKLGKLKAVAVKLPSKFYEDDWMDNLSIMVGGAVASEANGRPLSSVGISDLGFAKKVIVNKYETKIIDGNSDQERIESKIYAYTHDSQAVIGDKHRLELNKKTAFLRSRAAMISVGYSTELELREKGDRVEDSLSATRAAIEQGIVPGAGMTLIRACNMIDMDKVREEWKSTVEMLKDSCHRPARQILLNADLNPEEVINKSLENDDIFWGYNAANDEFCNLYESGVLDPAKVTKTALSNACSISLLLINTAAMVVENKQDESGWQPPAGWRPPSDTNLNHKY